MSKLLPRRYKSVIYKESKIMVVNSEIAQYAITPVAKRGCGRPVVSPWDSHGPWATDSWKFFQDLNLNNQTFWWTQTFKTSEVFPQVFLETRLFTFAYEISETRKVTSHKAATWPKDFSESHKSLQHINPFNSSKLIYTVLLIWIIYFSYNVWIRIIQFIFIMCNLEIPFDFYSGKAVRRFPF